jgi:hypothetical protein
MARGSIAKENVVKILKKTFGESFIGEYDKKYYVFADDGGEQVQISIALTCPKNPIAVDKSISVPSGDYDFSDDAIEETAVAVISAEPAEITEQEQENLAKLMSRLGL